MGYKMNHQSSEERRFGAEAKIRQIMSRNSVLARLEPHLAHAVILGKHHESRVQNVRQAEGWDDGALNLVIEYWVKSGRMTLVSFRAGRSPNGFPECHEHFVVYVESVTETSITGDAVYIEHLINPDQDKPLRYEQFFFDRDCICSDPVFLDLSDMLLRFPSSVELLADRVSLITDTIRPDGMGDLQEDRHQENQLK